MAVFNGIGINPKKFHRSQIKFYIIIMPLVLFTSLPILFIFSQAFKPLDELFSYPPRFFVRRPTWENFANLFNSVGLYNTPILRYLFNSIITTIGVVILSILISAAAGYTLSKKDFRLKNILFEINTLSLMFVSAAVGIPRFLIMVNLNLIDNFMAHILPMMAIPVGLFLVKQFIDQVPNALIESAQIDGASDYYILIKIIMPIIRPALSTVAILAFQMSWNSSDTSANYINSENLKTFAFFMSSLATGNSFSLSSSAGNSVAGQGAAAAGSLLMFIPNLIIFIILQSRIMNTMVHSGIK